MPGLGSLADRDPSGAALLGGAPALEHPSFTRAAGTHGWIGDLDGLCYKLQ